jgi:hypothetical protein
MDNALGPDQPHQAGGADDQLVGRYVMGDRLSHDGKVQTFRATDRWLHRPVVMVFDTGSGGRALTETCQAMAGVLSPNLVGIYDRGGNASYRFVVCEYPTSTVAALAQQSDRSLWNEGRAIDAAKQLAVALSDLQRSGVDTRGLHLGSIGIDESGRVRLSPWPLAACPGIESGMPAPSSELELLAWVLESGAYSGSSISTMTADLAARFRQTSREGAALTLDQLLGALDGLGPSARDKPTGEVPVVTGAVSLATGVVPVTTGAVSFGHDPQSHTYRRRRLRARWPVAAGAGIAALAAFLVINLGSSNAPAPAAASSQATGSCTTNAKGCPASGVPQSPSSTVVTPNVPGTSVSGSDAAATSPDTTPPVDTTPTTAFPSTTTTTTTTTTTVAPSTTTTTGPESTTTTTTGVPSTTTTTAPNAALSGTQSATAQP